MVRKPNKEFGVSLRLAVSLGLAKEAVKVE
jgi:hypothetical protein